MQPKNEFVRVRHHVQQRAGANATMSSIKMTTYFAYDGQNSVDARGHVRMLHFGDELINRIRSALVQRLLENCCPLAAALQKV